jgi:hypothetical protein
MSTFPDISSISITQGGMEAAKLTHSTTSLRIVTPAAFALREDLVKDNVS